MQKSVIFFFVFHILLGACLPKGDFAFLSQIPKIYQQYEVINGKTDFFEFVEEQFLSVNELFEGEESEEEDEEEQISVQISYQFQGFLLYFPSLFDYEPQFYFYCTKETPTIYNAESLQNFIGAIFRPPRFSSLT